MSYDGFTIKCGCCCIKCGCTVALEGYADASGTHFCAVCNDYVRTLGRCAKRTAELIAERQAEINEAGADKD